MELMRGGAFFWKHDFGRSKRTRKWMWLTKDGLTLKWKAVGKDDPPPPAGDGTDRGSPSSRGVFGRSTSFSRVTSSTLALPPAAADPGKEALCSAQPERGSAAAARSSRARASGGRERVRTWRRYSAAAAAAVPPVCSCGCGAAVPRLRRLPPRRTEAAAAIAAAIAAAVAAAVSAAMTALLP